jgi:hypothetical protein
MCEWNDGESIVCLIGEVIVCSTFSCFPDYGVRLMSPKKSDTEDITWSGDKQSFKLWQKVELDRIWRESDRRFDDYCFWVVSVDRWY